MTAAESPALVPSGKESRADGNPYQSPQAAGPGGADSGALRSDLRCSLTDAGLYGVMVGLGETYVPAFALALGKGEIAAGLIATVPMVLGAVIQMAAPMGVRWAGSYRRWVVGCAILQAMSFVPLVITALLGSFPTWALFLVVTVYWANGLATGPAWNTWIGSLIPYRLRAQHFALRSRINQAMVLVGFLGAGVSLQYGKAVDEPLFAFALLFAAAWIFRLASAWVLSCQSEPEPPDQDDRDVPVPEVLRRFRHGSDGRLLVYMLALQVGLQVAGPYFTPFMLRHLDFSYVGYVFLIGCSFLTKVIALPILGRWAHRFGAQRLLWIGGAGVVPLAALWAFSSNYYYLIFTQVLSGVMWAAYELGAALLFFEHIRPEERTSVLTTFNLGNSLAVFTGSLIGAGILMGLGETHSAYLVVFVTSSVLRLLTIVLLVRAATPVGEAAALGTRTLAIRPEAGADARPILVGKPAAEREE